MGAVVSPEAAVAAVLSGCFLIFFGYYTYRTTIVIYLAVVGGILGGVIGQRVVESAYPLAWTLGGALVGALLAVPVEAFMRVMLGVVSGGVLGLAVGVLVGNFIHAAVGLAIGAVVGAALWAWLGDVFIMAMFALMGAVDVLIGVQALAAHYGRPFSVTPLSVLGVVVSAVLGTAFQYILVHPPKGPVPEREGRTYDDLPRQ